VLDRDLFRNTLYGATARAVDADAVAAAGRALLDAAPRTPKALGALLHERWPEHDPAGLAYVVRNRLATVQVPPRGLWGQSGQPRWALMESWLGAEPAEGSAVDALLLRYLAAFGPASVADMRTWSTLTGLRAVVERLRPRLRTFRDERGTELFDVPDGPIPDPSTPAPPRFLPEYDNALLSHADRSRILGGRPPGPPLPTGRWVGSLLVDGFHRAYWRITEERGSATLTAERFVPHPDDPPGAADEIVEEGDRLLAFVAPGAARRAVHFTPPLRAPRAP
jgi:hypothetical protein